MNNIFLDYAAATPIKPKTKDYIVSLLDSYANPSSTYSMGIKARDVIETARARVSKFMNTSAKNILFTSSGAASNSLIIKGLANENPNVNGFLPIFSPAAHKSMVEACNSCWYKAILKVDTDGRIDLKWLKRFLKKHSQNSRLRPLVCFEVANSEIGTINAVQKICCLVHRYNGVVVADATAYIPTNKVDMSEWADLDFLTFSGHKLGSLKGVGVVYTNRKTKLRPLIYGSQEEHLFGGTENLIGIASLGQAVTDYNYDFVNPQGRDYVWDYVRKNIPRSRLVGAKFGNRLKHNLSVCFEGVDGSDLVALMDEYNIQISTGSACNNAEPTPSSTLLAIGMDEKNIHNVVRLTFSGEESLEELDYINKTLDKCVKNLRLFSV